MLDVPVIGVASSQWTVDDLQDRARDSITDVRRRCRRRGRVRAAHRAAALRRRRLQRRRRRSRSSSRRSATRACPAHYLAIPPSMFEIVVEGLGTSGCAEQRPRDHREAVRPRPRVGDGAEPGPALRVPGDRTSSASTTTSARRRSRTSSTSGSRTRSSSRSGTATTCARCRSRWRRTSACRAAAASTRRSARSATSSRTTCSRRVALLAMEPPVGPGAEELRDAKENVFKAMRHAEARTTSCAGSSRATATSRASRPTPTSRRSPRCACTSTRGGGRACRSTSAPARTCRSTCTEVRVELHRPPQTVFAEYEQMPHDTNYFRFQLDPRIVIAVGVAGQGRGRRLLGRRRRAVPLQRPRRGGVGRTSGCSSDAMDGEHAAVRPRGRRRGVVAGRRPRARPTTARRIPYAVHSWGPEEQDRLIDDRHGWHNPVPEDLDEPPADRGRGSRGECRATPHAERAAGRGPVLARGARRRLGRVRRPGRRRPGDRRARRRRRRGRGRGRCSPTSRAVLGDCRRRLGRRREGRDLPHRSRELRGRECVVRGRDRRAPARAHHRRAWRRCPRAAAVEIECWVYLGPSIT